MGEGEWEGRGECSAGRGIGEMDLRCNVYQLMTAVIDAVVRCCWMSRLDTADASREREVSWCLALSGTLLGRK